MGLQDGSDHDAVDPACRAMRPEATVDGLASRLEEAESADDIVQIMQRATEKLGFKHFSFATRFYGEGRLGKQIVLSTAPSQLLEWYEECGMLTFDSIGRECFFRSLPFYSDELDLEGGHHLSAPDSGIGRKRPHFGLTAQQHSPGAVTTCTFTGRGRWPPESRESTAAEAMWLVAHVHEATLRIYRQGPGSHAEPKQVLSVRELQCLSLTAKGWSAKEVSRKLAVPQRTVAYHVDRARRKLRAKTTMEAIASAMKAHQLELSMQPIPWKRSHRLIELSMQSTQAALSFAAIISGMRAATDFRDLGQACSAASRFLGTTQFALTLQIPVEGETRQFVVATRGLKESALSWQTASAPWLPARRAPSADPASECSGEADTIGMRAYSPGGAISQFVFIGKMIEARQIAFSFARTAHVRAVELARREVHDEALTERELECLRFAAEGKSYTEVAARIGCTNRAVRYHLDCVSFKCNARNIRAAVVKSFERGLIALQQFPERLSSSDVFWHSPVADSP